MIHMLFGLVIVAALCYASAASEGRQFARQQRRLANEQAKHAREVAREQYRLAAERARQARQAARELIRFDRELFRRWKAGYREAYLTSFGGVENRRVGASHA